MGDAPYRPEPATTENEALLARLAAQGQKRLHDAAEADARRAFGAEEQPDAKGERTIRKHLAAYDGTWLRKAWCFALVGVGAVLFAVALPRGDVADRYNYAAAVAGAGFSSLIGGAVVLLVWRPLARPGRVLAERAWVKSLPFLLEGYFDVLSTEPADKVRLLLQIDWQGGRAPGYDTLQGVLANWDAAAVVGAHEGGATVQGGPFEMGWTVARRNRGGFVDRAHRLVEQALLPLHGSYAIARVVLKTEEVVADG